MLPGPWDGASWITGHQQLILSGEDMKTHEAWIAEYGGTFVLRGLLVKYQLVTTYARPLTHVLFATHVFQKATAQRRGLRRLVGEGLPWSEEARHRDQRRLMSPAFSHAHVREMTGIFLEKAAKAKALPGITPGLLSFNGGPRSCVGHRFDMAERKALLFHIVPQFEVRLAVDKSQIWTRTSTVMRPQLRDDDSVQLPVMLKFVL
ncbi:hypothetical protein AURDEDRAFT_171837 [Auricularia subglabra TFB-10046 SS5]|uniref:Cytochrome P450 n=1 Tax=Auricularia subglabra (strain TFB-10046 / SS5) TaxID=717982 RepID=J0DBS4_AURST|nr:hypothetical protein AURDEDRAFT_171837 [Auricularia subglabra TFB-10046 SS5]